MGSPKRIRKKYEKPKMMWDKIRIDNEHKLRDSYGLRNLKELWKAASELRRVRRNVRAVLSGRASEETGKNIISRLAKYNIIRNDASLDDILVIKTEAILERRLQSVVYRKGMSKSLKQSRQLITHGFISINGRRVKSPGYLVRSDEEKAITYYKPININAGDIEAAPNPNAPAIQEAEAAKAVEKVGA